MGIFEIVAGLVDYVSSKVEEGLPGAREHTHALHCVDIQERGKGMIFGTRYDYKYQCVVPGCDTRVTSAQQGDIPAHVGSWRQATSIDLDAYLAHAQDGEGLNNSPRSWEL